MGLFSTSCDYFSESSGVRGRTAGCSVHPCRTLLFNQPSLHPQLREPQILPRQPPGIPLHHCASAWAQTTSALPALCVTSHSCDVPGPLHSLLLPGLKILPGKKSRLFLLHPKFLSIPCGIRTITELCHGAGVPGWERDPSSGKTGGRGRRITSSTPTSRI